MKIFPKFILIAALLLCSHQSSLAVVAVHDVGLIRTNLWNAQRDLTEQILQGKRQLEQIRGLYSQIKQAETLLQRLGDPRGVTLTTLQDALSFLQQVNLNRSWEELVRDVNGEELFQRENSTVAPQISRRIEIDGQTVAETDSSVLALETASHRASEHYQQVRDAALEQRPLIKGEMDRTLQQLKLASTSTEIQKLNVVLRSLESQLAANDREIAFASSAVLTSYLQKENERDIQAKLQVQHQRAALRYSAEKDVALYEISAKRVPFER